ncbi:hypothetical protein CR513_30491, partial [Mucuna pruriens]
IINVFQPENISGCSHILDEWIALNVLKLYVGAFVGVSLEGNIVATRMDANFSFYGDPYLSRSDILLGMVERPKAAEPLYAALEDLYSSLCN